MQGRVLIIAGSDSGGGAGIQGDIKTVSVLGGYAATAVTALTAQNTLGVFGIHEVPHSFIRQQMELVLSDIGADALKTGMLHSAEVIHTVADVIAAKAKQVPLVVDPVMVAKGGTPLLQEQAVKTLTRELLPLADIITPNIPEAELLAGMSIISETHMKAAGERILSLGCKTVLMKGGHLEGKEVVDLLMEGNKVTRFASPRIDSRHTHGTGCALASAIATGLAQGMNIKDSVARAREYVQKAIRNAPGLGRGYGPLKH